jgi:hypothetical protein
MEKKKRSKTKGSDHLTFLSMLPTAFFIYSKELLYHINDDHIVKVVSDYLSWLLRYEAGSSLPHACIAVKFFVLNLSSYSFEARIKRRKQALVTSSDRMRQ